MLPHAHLHCSQRVGQRLAVGVVEVTADLVHAEVLQRRLDGALHLQRRADADGVGHGHLLHADVLQQSRQVVHALGSDLTLVGAAHGAAHGGTHLHARSQRSLDHRRKALDAFGDGAVDVLLAEGFAGRAKHRHFVGLRQHRCLVALHVGHQHRIDHARLALDRVHHLSVVAHLRHPLGADKAGGFQLGHAGIHQAVDQVDLDLGGHGLLFVLQAVTRAEFDDLGFGGKHGKPFGKMSGHQRITRFSNCICICRSMFRMSLSMIRFSASRRR